MRIGIDVGSTTVKVVILNEDKQLIFKKYQRHFADVANCVLDVLKQAQKVYDGPAKLTITGSAGMGLAEILDLAFVQEVIACTEAIEEKIPQTDVAIELGGEDAKITFFEGSLEQRMNGSCAGGTGAFIDQMAALLQTEDRKSTRLNSSHVSISYAVFCLKKKNRYESTYVRYS